MNRFFLSLLIWLGVSGTLFASEYSRSAIPESGEIVFDVFRGDSRFGTHILRFEEVGDQLRVEADVDLRVRIGPITVFRYEHDAVELYRDGILQRLESSTLKDGELLRVNVQRDGEQLVGTGSDNDGNRIDLALPAELIASSHWRAYTSDISAVLNTETGEAMDVTITDMGVETIELGGRTINARRVRMEASLTLDLWYDLNGEWLRCQFSARGQEITYVRRNI